MSKSKRKSKINAKKEEKGGFSLPLEIQQIIIGILIILIAVLTSLSFFHKAGKAGDYFIKGGRFLIGNSIFVIPLILFLAGLAFLNLKKGREIFEEGKSVFLPIFLGVLIFVLSFSGMLGTFNPEKKEGGWIGYFLSWFLLKYLGALASRIVFLALMFISVLILRHFLIFTRKKEGVNNKEDKKEEFLPEIEKKPSIIKRIFKPKFKIKKVSSLEEKEGNQKEREMEEGSLIEEREKKIKEKENSFYQPPPVDLLEVAKGSPTSGDTKSNSAIIKKTLHDFGIEVTMSEVNIGPTVTQYTLKPAEGVKLSKITNLANNLSLALASHPIRIEAPIPGRSLVGIEIPNKTRAKVYLRELVENSIFQRSANNLLLALGKDVSGTPAYADLTKMPHLLVAGSTGAGKTIFLNSLILSLLYQPTTFTRSASPENLRFILVDPKRVEFTIYENLPHLLCPVIYNASATVNALKWLVGEMERRFDVLASVKARDIGSFNQNARRRKESPLPFIVLIIDELADLMAAKGKEIESYIVRLAQMSRAVGIHLVLATQRPSVEVITGLIKANITSRVAFQVASQFDSRTIIDVAGAEKLLGAGDMLFVSTQSPKPKRIQAPYVSDKEVKRVVHYVISKSEEIGIEAKKDESLKEILERSEELERMGIEDEEEPLYEEAKQMVIESQRASASFLQRRLRIGYARAARIIDMLEERGIVGPAEGSKPREVYGDLSSSNLKEEDEFFHNEEDVKSEDNEWKKV